MRPLTKVKKKSMNLLYKLTVTNNELKDASQRSPGSCSNKDLTYLISSPLIAITEMLGPNIAWQTYNLIFIIYCIIHDTCMIV